MSQTGPDLALTVLFDTVKIEITCSSAYESQVLFDDLSERFLAGESITIEPSRRKTFPP